MNANENWADLSTVSSARERGWSAVGELASRCRDLSCSELSSGVAEMRQSFLGAEMQRPTAHQFVTNFTSCESSTLDPLSEFSDDLSR